jgi:hypothetical protein
MSDFTYEVIKSTNPITGETITNVMRSDGALIPSDPANADYQEYLNPSEASAE